MVGKKRFAAKLTLLTTLLAAAGAGAYYATVAGGWPRLFGGETSATQLVVDDSTATNADLDAVASSWATAGTSQKDAGNSTSASARSADETLAHADAALTTPTVGSRYALPATTPPAATAVVDAAPVAEEASEPTPASGVEPAEPTIAGSAIVESDAEPTLADLESSNPLTRGQEPNDEDVAAKLAAADVSPTAESSPPKAAAQEPKSLDLPDSTSASGASARRAREAFRDQPAGKTAAATPAVGGRYAASTASSSTAQPSEPTAAASGTGVANPFAAQPLPVTATPAAATEPREFSASLPTDSAAPLNQANAGPAALDAQLPSASIRSARASLGSGTNEYRSGGQSPSLSSLPTPLPSSSNSESISSTTGGIDGTGKPGERALEGPQKPALTIQKFAPPEIQVGKPAKFAVQVRNIGGQVAENVVILDQVPAGTRLVSTTPTAEADGSQLVWQLGKLSVGEERTVEMQLMPVAEGEVGSVATVSYSAQASAKSRCTMPQLAIRMTAPSEVMIGAEQRVKIELRNPGTGDATGVMLFENVPQNVKHAAGPTLEFEIGTLRAGETRELELVLTAEKAGKVVNILSAKADGNLQVQQQVEFEVIAPALTVAVNGPERRYLERPATYEVSVENPGTATAHDVQLVTKLPKGMQFVRANNMGEYDAATHAVYWSLAELPQGETGTVEVVAMPIEIGPQTLQVEGRAQQGLTDQAQQQIQIEGIAAIMFEVRDLEDPIEVGGETGYEIRVVNQGTKAATNLRVSINLPPGMQVVSAEGETQHKAQAGGIAFEPLAQLAPKADTVFRVKVQGVQPGDQRVTVEVNTDDLGQPIRREESTRVFGDE
jgi:uncharacterized repeat protein (TIGR01451 family)